jgi:nucleotide-binding universal stress UspA family protein
MTTLVIGPAIAIRSSVLASPAFPSICATPPGACSVIERIGRPRALATKNRKASGLDEQLMGCLRLPCPIIARVNYGDYELTEKLQNKVTKPLWNHILVPVSFAPSSEKALRAAFDIARRQGSELFALHAAHDPIIQSEAGIGTFSLPGAWPRELKRRRRQLDCMVAKQLNQARRALAVTKLIVEGDPEHQIPDIAREKKIDLIVLGRHRETALEHFFIRRNIDRIVGHADCAVESGLQAVELL